MDARTKENLLTEAEASISYSSFGLVTDTLLLNAVGNLGSKMYGPGIVFLFISTIAFILSVPIYAAAVGEITRLDRKPGTAGVGTEREEPQNPITTDFIEKRMSVANILTIYWGFLPATISIPLILSAKGMTSVSIITFISVFVGVFGYSSSRFSLLRRYFEPLQVLGISLLIAILYAILFVSNAAPELLGNAVSSVKVVVSAALVVVLLSCSGRSFVGEEMHPETTPTVHILWDRVTADKTDDDGQIGTD